MSFKLSISFEISRSRQCDFGTDVTQRCG